MRGTEPLTHESNASPAGQLHGVTAISAQPAEVAPVSAGRSSVDALTVICLVALLTLTLAAYSPVLFNFFAGDDFVHLTWLKEAVRQPELIWRNFHSSWLDGTTTKFYRPLISVFMVADYLCWKTNGLGFHITNLLFHTASSLFLYGFLRCIPTWRKARLIPLTAAALFALYPLHPEAVSWITGRVDAVVTAFSLASIWSYARWRESANKTWLAGSIVAFILGLLSKEMAVTIPAVLFTYEFLFVQQDAIAVFDKLPRAIFRSLRATLPFWLLILAYFGVRRLALGTFVGGYDDSLLFIADKKAFILGWLHALRMTLVPINRELLGAHSMFTKAWEVFVGGALLALAVTVFRQPAQRKPLLFMLAWLAFCLVPVYKIFAVADDLQGSRLAYLATVPLCCLLAQGLSAIPGAWFRRAVVIAMCMLTGFLLWTNNQPWRQAGLESNAIRAGLQNVYSQVSGDPQLLFIGLPDQIRGAYVCRNALYGMTKSPQMARDAYNGLMVNEFEPVQPFGFLKRSMIASAAQIKVYAWQHDRRQFAPVRLPAQAELNQSMSLPVVGSGSTEGKSGRPFAIIDCSGVPCWNVDFVDVAIQIEDAGTTATGADLLYANSLSPQFQLAKRTHVAVERRAGSQHLCFALHSLPEWSLGTQPARLKLLLPVNCHARIISAQAIPPAVLLPRIEFPNSGYLGTKGYLHLGHSQPLQQVSSTISTIPGASHAQLEITRANLLFEQQNCTELSRVSQPLKPVAADGKITLNVKDFPTPGIYEARIWAKDKANKTVGVASDHIVISVDP